MSRDLEMSSSFIGARGDVYDNSSHGMETEKPEDSMFRSKEMEYVRITVSNDSVSETINALGYFGKLHVVDLANPVAPTKKFTAYKKRVTDLNLYQRSIDTLLNFMETKGFEVPPPIDLSNTEVPDFKGDVLTSAREFVTGVEANLQREVATDKLLNIQLSGLKEDIEILMAAEDLMVGASEQADNASGNVEEKAMMADGHAGIELFGNVRANENAGLVSYIFGIIPAKVQDQFSRMVFRISRGNAFSKFKSIEEKLVDPETGLECLKSAFCIVCLGENVAKKVTRLVPLSQGRVYTKAVPESKAEIADQILALKSGRVE